MISYLDMYRTMLSNKSSLHGRLARNYQIWSHNYIQILHRKLQFCSILRMTINNSFSPDITSIIDLDTDNQLAR